MNHRIFVFVFFALSLVMSCQNKPSIGGLWIVKLVKVGDQEMTPNARWTRLNADFTHESGNGRLQHSYGTWHFDTNTRELSIVTENGLADPYEAFNVRFKNGQMLWDRVEEGEQVQVVLERVDRLPETYGDQLLGLWQLESAEGSGKYFAESASSPANGFIFFRWDRRFVIGSDKGRINGVYNVHGHRPEVEFIPYGEQLVRDFWSFDASHETITLKLLNSDSLVTRKFKRIYEFPQ